MAITAFKKFISRSEEIARLIDAVSASIGSLISKQIVDGALLNDISLTSGSANNVAHGLGHPVNGYLVVKNSAQATIWDEESTNANKSIFLKLQTSTSCTVSLWVF